MQTCTGIYYSNVLLIAQLFLVTHRHHQEHKNCNCSLWFYITNFWYVTRSRVPSTLSRYGVTMGSNVTSVHPA